jgi:hypothetical protein
MTLGTMSAAPGKWQKAGLDEDECEAKRYYVRACALKDAEACRLADEAKAKIAAGKLTCTAASGAGGE